MLDRYRSGGWRWAFWAYTAWSGEWRFYFRIFGYGLLIGNEGRPSFSERMGLRKRLRLRGVLIEVLVP